MGKKKQIKDIDLYKKFKLEKEGNMQIGEVSVDNYIAAFHYIGFRDFEKLWFESIHREIYLS